MFPSSEAWSLFCYERKTNMTEKQLKAIGERIKEKRDSLGISQTDLAEGLGITVPYLERVEKGTKSMSIETLMAISEKLGTTTDYILRGRDVNQSEQTLDEVKDIFNSFTAEQAKDALFILEQVRDLWEMRKNGNK